MKSVASCQEAAFFSDGHSLRHTAGAAIWLEEGSLERRVREEKTMYLVETFGDQIDGKLPTDSVHPGHILLPNGFREEGSQPRRHVVHLLQQIWEGERVRCLMAHTTVDVGEVPLSKGRRATDGRLEPIIPHLLGTLKCQVCCPVLEAFTLPFLPGWRRSVLMAVDELDQCNSMTSEGELKAKNSKPLSISFT